MKAGFSVLMQGLAALIGLSFSLIRMDRSAQRHRKPSSIRGKRVFDAGSAPHKIALVFLFPFLFFFLFFQYTHINTFPRTPLSHFPPS
ncbi:hypothetical protein F4775DRAFT_7634 [Biscogniauxia sp. FL1348]|nr:hypothetical protein F4775DRAFT_7634 [Biscogniauxia sp. FL1348]